jgi:hypothetical protein
MFSTERSAEASSIAIVMNSQIDRTMFMKSQIDGRMSGVELIRHFRNTMRERGDVKLTSMK